MWKSKLLLLLCFCLFCFSALPLFSDDVEEMTDQELINYTMTQLDEAKKELESLENSLNQRRELLNERETLLQQREANLTRTETLLNEQTALLAMQKELYRSLRDELNKEKDKSLFAGLGIGFIGGMAIGLPLSISLPEGSLWDGG